MSTSSFMTLDELLLGRRGSHIGTPRLRLPTQVVKQTPLDRLEFDDFAYSSPRFHELCVTDAPQIPVDVPEPAPIDITKVTPDELIAYQQAAKAAREATESAPPYGPWDKLTRDVFASYHTRDLPEVLEQVDPSVDLHRRIMPKAITTEDHAASRHKTRQNPTMSAIATMAFVGKLRELLGDELRQQAEEVARYESKVHEIENMVDDLDELREDAQHYIENGQPVPDDLRDRIKTLVLAKRAAQSEAYDMAVGQTPIGRDAMDAIAQAAKAANDAAQHAGGLPSFGSGFGAGEPVYESPEQALTIAQMWADNPKLRAIAERFGRFSPDIRFLRAKRVVGGNDEIVDVEFGDNLSRVLPQELMLLTSDDELFELDFLGRYADEELLQFSTVGEEHAGRGPIICLVDGSYSMEGERTIWARAIAMCLLHIARLEKRDFCCIEFASANKTELWQFLAKEPLDPQQIINMASHFYGGGTSPIQGVAEASRILDEAPPFKKADIVMIGDGEASFGPEDQKLRDRLMGRGVRLFGMAIGESKYKYLTEYCEAVVHVHDFELQDPSEATAALAVSVT
ncbi:MAG: vWA domain-containing protein [Solirubrobacteraceae bacterium]|jgi:uncharacterized protein with von Willebrand factor type A (vWA) domain